MHPTLEHDIDLGTVHRTATHKLQAQWAQQRYLCMGLDPQPTLITTPTTASGSTTTPETDLGAVLDFLRRAVDHTADLVTAYKPNLAFFEALGAPGWMVLEALITHIRDCAPDVLVIADGKRGDVATTSAAYARSLFDHLGVDAATVNPYLGQAALAPLLHRAGSLLFVVCRTSGPGAGEFQDLQIGPRRLFEHVAHQVATTWDSAADLGLVVGATTPQDLDAVAQVAPGLPLLIPGVGAQGGDVDTVLRVLRTGGHRNVLISASQSLLYPVRHDDQPGSTRAAALALHRQLAAGLA